MLRALGLTPQDMNGKADPFLVVRLGKQSKGSSDAHIPEELNPKFFRMFEFNSTFPGESVLNVSAPRVVGGWPCH